MHSSGVRSQESGAEAMRRLAALGRQQGVRLLHDYATGDTYALSSTGDPVLYRLTIGGCSCEGFRRWNRCKHYSLYLLDLSQPSEDEGPSPIEFPGCRGCGQVA